MKCTDFMAIFLPYIGNEESALNMLAAYGTRLIEAIRPFMPKDASV